MKQKPKESTEDKQIYYYARFYIKESAVEKLKEFLKANTKTYQCGWKNYPIGITDD
jgi:hypothetical protein